MSQFFNLISNICTFGFKLKSVLLNQKTTYLFLGLVCANCKTSNTPGWRAAGTPDQKLCNACGLYFSKYKSHRPNHLWNNLRNKSA
ncbi:hypothetical protein C1645_178972 [Glomus cerebriforme]|uniref:GATA-type domain-containing protein n=1 Tax=Glomus cerebriforme TaxID=658196 RepID=A0A397TLB3_9GLOM|nr:hypothetical protein C1645_178972 [Glomus cerebriforme]